MATKTRNPRPPYLVTCVECDDGDTFPAVAAMEAVGWTRVSADVDETNAGLFWTHVGVCPGCSPGGLFAAVKGG